MHFPSRPLPASPIGSCRARNILLVPQTSQKLVEPDPSAFPRRLILQQIPEAGPGRPIPPPNQGMADTMDEAKAAFAKRYEEVIRGK